MSENPRKQLLEQLDRLETAVMVAGENGLFVDAHGKQSLTEICTLSNEARAAPEGTPGDQTVNLNSLKIQTLCSAEIHRRENFGWRIVYVYGLPNFIGGTLAYVTVCWVLAHYADETPATFLKALLWGATGGYVQGLYFTVQNLFLEQLRQAWISWAPLTPLLGALMGLIVLQAVLAGTGLLEVKTTMSAEEREYLHATVATFAGFRWRWAIAKLTGVFEKA